MCTHQDLETAEAAVASAVYCHNLDRCRVCLTLVLICQHLHVSWAILCCWHSGLVGCPVYGVWQRLTWLDAALLLLHAVLLSAHCPNTKHDHYLVVQSPHVIVAVAFLVLLVVLISTTQAVLWCWMVLQVKESGL